MNLHVHISETEYEHEMCLNKYGKTPTQILCEYGVFEAKTTAAHCVHTIKEDWEILKEHNVSVVHCPISNLKLASGIAPIQRMMKYGVNITVGTDGVSSNNSNDMFEEMKMLSILQKNMCADPSVLPPYDVIKMLTVNGAYSQGRGNESGQIKIGYDADLIILDLDNANTVPCYNPFSNIVYSANSRNVVFTICQGEILFEKGEYKTIDYEKIIDSVKSIVNKLF